MIVSNPMSRFPKEGLVLFWNFQHGRCQPDASGVIHDIAPQRGWTAGPTPLTPVSGAGFGYDIGGFAKGISLDGSHYYSFDGSLSHFAAPANWEITEMHWWWSDSWGQSNTNGYTPYGQNGVVWRDGTGGLGWWFMDYSTGAYNDGVGFGRMTSNMWSIVDKDNDGQTFDKPSNGGGDVLNKWYCGVFTTPSTGAKGYLFGEPAIYQSVSDVTNNWTQDTTARFGDGPDGLWQGKFGMFARWNRVLSDAEIKLAYDATKGYFGIQR